MLDATRIRDRNLKRLFERGDESGIRADWRGKTKRILAALNVAVAPEEMDLPSYGWHRLKADRRDTFALTVSRNWRITHKWDNEGPYDVDLEDYHGN